jgi:putative flippase GtrA
MAIAQNRLVAATWQRLRSKVGIRFTRFVGVAAASLATSEILLAICDSLLHLTAVPAALVSTFGGAVVSYVLSRWAWERKGKPDVLRETVPFWVISAMVWVILTLATKFGYHLASWMGLDHGVKRAAVVGLVYLAANVVTFILRFVIFHYVLFADRTTAARAAATGPDAVPPGTRVAPAPADVAASTASDAAPAASSTAASSTAASSTAAGNAPASSAAEAAPAKSPTAKAPTAKAPTAKSPAAKAPTAKSPDATAKPTAH